MPYNIEPITIIEVQWTDDFMKYRYADRDITINNEFIPGRILALSELAFSSSYVNSISAQVSFTVDDTAGDIKELFDNFDFHKRWVTVYQTYGDDPNLNDVIFKGQISSPIVWEEHTRSFQITAISVVEDEEVGYSPEEGEHDFVSHDAIGKVWPLAFGHVVHVPATPARTILRGTLKDPLSIVDPSIERQMRRIDQAFKTQQLIRKFFETLALGAKAIHPPLMSVLMRYCRLIVDKHRGYLGVVKLVKSLNVTRRKMEAKRPARDPNDLDKFQEDQPKLLQLAMLLHKITLQKTYLEKYTIPFCEWAWDVKQDAFRKQIQAYEQIKTLWTMYRTLENKRCEQQRYAKTQFEVAFGEKFPQGQLVDIAIDGLRWSGTFSGNTFTVAGQAKALYTDVVLATREDAEEEEWDADQQCKELDHEKWETFWIADDTKLLQGQYLLVTSKYDGKKHIVKVREQQGHKCRLELIERKRNGDNARKFVNHVISDFFFPVIPGRFGMLPHGMMTRVGMRPWSWNTPVRTGFEGLPYVNRPLLFDGSDVIDAMLSGVPVSEDEFKNLKTIQRILPSDYSLWKGKIGVFTLPQIVVHFPSPQEVYTIIGEDISAIHEVSAVPLEHWYTDSILEQEIPDETPWMADEGSSVILIDDLKETHIVNTLPSTVKAVMAYKTDEGNRHLVPVPEGYYTVTSKTIDTMNCCVVEMKVPLDMIPGEDWEPQLYVTFESSVGPKITDILKHLISTYTDYTHDTTTFDAVEALFTDKYPANFAILDRRNIMQVLHEIAWQSRCAIYLDDGKFYLKYLASEPEITDTLANKDVIFESLRVEYSATEDVVTKFTGFWRMNYLPLEEGEEPLKVVIRHNVERFGIQEFETDFYIFNDQSLVEKSATFWALRMANTWKYVSLNIPLSRIERPQLFEAYQLQLPGVDNIKGIVEAVSIDTNNFEVSLKLWLPVIAGCSKKYPYAWPADLPADTVFDPEWTEIT